MKDYRPITLFNVVYKIMAKVLVMRLCPVPGSVIGDHQYIFLKDRRIYDNIIIAYEIISSLRLKRVGKVGSVVLKLDMSKAFDKVEWGFLHTLMMRLNFPNVFVDLIFNCIKTVSYSVLVNGEKYGLFSLERGVRQSDSLSPYLFLLYSEGLACLSKKATKNNILHGLSASRCGPLVSHLFFIDDSLLFCRASLGDCRAICEIL